MRKLIPGALQRLFKRSNASDFQPSRVRKWQALLSPGRLWTAFVSKLGNLFGFSEPDWLKTLGNRLTNTPDRKPTAAQWVNPVFWIKWTFGFALTWLISRPFTSIFPAIPAVVMTVLLLGTFVVQRLDGSSRQKREYARKLDAAVREKDHDRALIAVGKLIDYSPDSSRLRFQRALIEYEIGDQEAARRQINQLVLNNDGGAALWLIEQDFDLSLIEYWKKEDHIRFRSLIGIALEDSTIPDSRLPKILMAKYLNTVGAKSDALKFFGELAVDDKDFALASAILAKSMDKAEQSIHYANLAVGHYQNLLVKDPTNLELRLNLTRSLVLAQREKEAISILNDGQTIDDSPDIPLAAAEAMVAWAVRLQKQQKSDSLLARLQLLKKASEISPNNPVVTNALVDTILECFENDEQQIARLRNAAMNGLDPGEIHFIRGTVALLQGNIEEASGHLRMAAKHDKDIPGVLNNLAVAMASRENADLEQSLRLADMAITQLPDHPYLLETRGQIYFKLKQYEKAIADLELSLSAKELHDVILPSLIQCYRSIGEDGIANDYQKSLDELNFKKGQEKSDA